MALGAFGILGSEALLVGSKALNKVPDKVAMYEYAAVAAIGLVVGAYWLRKEREDPGTTEQAAWTRAGAAAGVLALVSGVLIANFYNPTFRNR